MRAIRDRYGFLFWLRWILWFAGSFVIAALGWTGLMKLCFGDIKGPELTITWCVAVFGSWFLLVIPFMRKKEQIWKRLNQDQEKGVDAWFTGMGIFIGLLIASSFFWSVIFKKAIQDVGMYPVWAKAVFASWLVFLIPFLVIMYRQADSIFKSAEARQTYNPQFKSMFIDASQRMLPELVAERLKGMPATLPNGHLVTVVLKDGQKVPYVFVRSGREILGVYDRTSLGFVAEDVLEIELADKDKLPNFDESKWLRLDLIS